MRLYGERSTSRSGFKLDKMHRPEGASMSRIDPLDAPKADQLAVQNDLDHATTQRPNKVFFDLRGQLALCGHTLFRSHPQDGEVTYWIERGGQARRLASLEAAADLLVSMNRRQSHA